MVRPRLVLVRHGESVWNAVKRWQGQADSPLSENGRQQALAVAGRLAVEEPPPRFAALWSSDLDRARETAAVLADAIGIAEIRLDPRLREAEAGPWEGLTPVEIERVWPGWLADNRRPDGFEPLEELTARALAVCDDLMPGPDGTADTALGTSAGEPDDPVMAVTHSGLIRTLRRHLGVDDVRIPNLGGMWLGRRADGRPEPLGWFDGTMRPSPRLAPDPSARSSPGEH